jgi:hypothetical protein
MKTVLPLPCSTLTNLPLPCSTAIQSYIIIGNAKLLCLAQQSFFNRINLSSSSFALLNLQIKIITRVIKARILAI